MEIRPGPLSLSLSRDLVTCDFAPPICNDVTLARFAAINGEIRRRESQVEVRDVWKIQRINEGVSVSKRRYFPLFRAKFFFSILSCVSGGGGGDRVSVKVYFVKGLGELC